MQCPTDTTTLVMSERSGIEIDADKIARETIYVGEPFDPPEWRAQWRVAP